MIFNFQDVFYNVVLSSPFAELSILLLLVVIAVVVAWFFRQPMIVGYIVIGIIAGPHFLDLVREKELLETFSHIGIALLLFIVWLWLNPEVVKDCGRASLVVGFGQIIFTTLLWFLLTLVLWFDPITSIYVSVALAFSSTIIIVKILTDKGVTNELFGKISIGMLIVQDIVAMFFLIIVSASQSFGADVAISSFVLLLLLKVVIVIAFLRLSIKYVISELVSYFARSQESLLLFSLTRCMILASLFQVLGFSMEVGALLAWVSLAWLPYRFEIVNKMKPLRDFFVILFFVYLWSTLQFGSISAYILPIIILSLFVLLGNPFIVTVLLWRMWYTPRTSLMVGFTVAQISEFSFILVAMWYSAGHINDPQVLVMVTVIGLVTMAGSSYYFAFADKLCQWFGPFVRFFSKKTVENISKLSWESYEVLLVWYKRWWKIVSDILAKNAVSFLVVDYDPHVIKSLGSSSLPFLYWDIINIDRFEWIDFSKIKMVISTTQDYDSNVSLVRFMSSVSSETIIICEALTTDDAIKLYDTGADYVVIPHVIGWLHTAMIIEKYWYERGNYIDEKVRHIDALYRL